MICLYRVLSMYNTQYVSTKGKLQTRGQLAIRRRWHRCLWPPIAAYVCTAPQTEHILVRLNLRRHLPCPILFVPAFYVYICSSLLVDDGVIYYCSVLGAHCCLKDRPTLLGVCRQKQGVFFSFNYMNTHFVVGRKSSSIDWNIAQLG